MAILGHGLWKRRFGGDPGVIGRETRLDGTPTTIVGVMPAAFDFPVAGTELWVPLRLSRTQPPNRAIPVEKYRQYRILNVVARLNAGSNVERARLELAAIAQQLETDVPRQQSQRRPRRRAASGDRRRLRASGAAAAPVRRGLRVADRVRERRQPAARARGRPHARDHHPDGARRRPRSPRAPDADREPGPGDRRRRRRPHRERLGAGPAAAIRATWHSTSRERAHGRERRRDHVSDRHRLRDDLRPRARVPGARAAAAGRLARRRAAVWCPVRINAFARR